MEKVTYLLAILPFFQVVAKASAAATPVPSVCGERFLLAHDDFRELSYPGNLSSYQPNLDCESSIMTQSSDMVVYVNVVLPPLRSRDAVSCLFEAYAYDGPDTTSEMIWSWCTTNTTSFTSIGRYLTLRFQSVNASASRGFKFQYQQRSGSAGCGKLLPAESTDQYIVFPGDWYQDRYQNVSHCTWTIRAKTGDNIKLLVYQSNIGSSTTCGDDAMEVYDGSVNGGNLLGKLCGSILPHYLSRYNVITVRVRTNGNLWDNRFALSYRSGAFNDVICGENLTATAFYQYFTSPEYPNLYQNNLTCIWIISTKLSKIKLKVTDSLLQSSAGCTSDNVTVYDDLSNAIIGTFCGNQTPTYFISSSSIRIVFVTDDKGRDKGFNINYRGGDTIGPCGDSRLRAHSYELNITSPGYPNVYTNYLECKWVITASIPFNIQLTILDVNIEYDLECGDDALEVFDGPTTDAPLLGKTCGTKLLELISSGNAITVTFHTDGVGVDRGFKLSYKSGEFTDAYNRPCANVSLTAYGFPHYLSTPQFPQEYPTNSDCKWTIQGKNLSQIQVPVHDADIELTSGCKSDVVTIYDGPSIYAHPLGTFCGRVASCCTSTSNIITVAFKTDGNNVSRGFRLSYISGHFEVYRHRNLTALPSSEAITSPAYPQLYPNSADCTWAINAGHGKYVVYIKITNLDIEYEAYCLADYLEAFDGHSGNGYSLGRWCGSELPPPKKSSGQFMFLKFHSNDNVRGNGFWLNYWSQYNTGSSVSGVCDRSSIGVVMSGISGGFVVALICCSLYCSSKGKQTNMTRVNSNEQSSRSSVSVIRDDFTLSGGLPTYEEAIAMDPAQSAQDSLPSYSNVNGMSETDML